MFEKLLEIQRHLLNYFPDAYIHIGVCCDVHPGRSETELNLCVMANGLHIAKKFTSYHDLLDYVQKMIFAETLVMNKRIEETQVYRQNWN